MNSKLTLLASALVTYSAFAAVPRATGEAEQRQFKTPGEAAAALVQLAATFDPVAVQEVLGPGCEDIVRSGDPVADRNEARAFAAKANEKLSVEVDKKDRSRATITVGTDNYPLPIPLVERDGKWSFDTKLGRQEILKRRVGANELNAIAICRGYAAAQRAYAAEKHDDAHVNQYAQKIISTAGKQDGLAWQNADGSWAGPVGPEAARALQDGYSGKPESAYHGYYFKVLTGQGLAAPLGEMDFVIGEAMIGGFALAAAPAEYRITGVNTFIVGADGKVYEKDLGKDTLNAFQTMDRYNPDESWQETTDDLEPAVETGNISASEDRPAIQITP